MKDVFFLRTYNTRMPDSADSSGVSIPLSAEGWDLTGIDGLDCSFLEEQATVRANAYTPHEINIRPGAREITITLSCKHKAIPDIMVYIGRYFNPGALFFLVWTRLNQWTVKMPLRFSGYTMNRFQQSVEIEATFSAMLPFFEAATIQQSVSAVYNVQMPGDTPTPFNIQIPNLSSQWNSIEGMLKVEVDHREWSMAYSGGFATPTEIVRRKYLVFDNIPQTSIPEGASLLLYVDPDNWNPNNHAADIATYMGGILSSQGSLLLNLDQYYSPELSDADLFLYPGMNTLYIAYSTTNTKPDDPIWTNNLLIQGTVYFNPRFYNAPSDGAEISTSAVIDPNAKPENIREGVSILGVEGSFEGGIPYEGPTTITPTTEDQIIDIEGKTPDSDITVQAISPQDSRNGLAAGERADLTPASFSSISSKDDVKVIAPMVQSPGWYTDGYPVENQDTIGVRISDTEKAKIIPENIREGVSILGVEGSFEGEAIPEYEGPTEVTPSDEEQILSTEAKKINSDITVHRIPGDSGSLIQLIPKSNISITDQTPQLDQDFDITSKNKWTVTLNPAEVPFYINKAGNIEFTIGIDENSYNNLIAANIRRNISILGITGALDIPTFKGTQFNIADDGQGYLRIRTLDNNDYDNNFGSPDQTGACIGSLSRLPSSGFYSGGLLSDIKITHIMGDGSILGLGNINHFYLGMFKQADEIWVGVQNFEPNISSIAIRITGTLPTGAAYLKNTNYSLLPKNGHLDMFTYGTGGTIVIGSATTWYAVMGWNLVKHASAELTLNHTEAEEASHQIACNLNGSLQIGSNLSAVLTLNISISGLYIPHFYDWDYIEGISEGGSVNHAVYNILEGFLDFDGDMAILIPAS